MDKDGNIVKIQKETFEDLCLGGIIVLTEKPEIIHKRLINRDSLQLSIDVIKEFQDLEIEYAKQIAGWLNIPFLESNSQMENVESFICTIWG